MLKQTLLDIVQLITTFHNLTNISTQPTHPNPHPYPDGRLGNVILATLFRS